MASDDDDDDDDPARRARVVAFIPLIDTGRDTRRCAALTASPSSPHPSVPRSARLICRRRFTAAAAGGGRVDAAERAWPTEHYPE